MTGATVRIGRKRGVVLRVSNLGLAYVRLDDRSRVECSAQGLVVTQEAK